MDELGIIIFPNGKALSFGKYVPADDPRYFSFPTHEESFVEEIVPSFEFKSCEFDYDDKKSVFQNLPLLVNQGLIALLNKDGGILAYVTPNPTLEQLNAIKSLKRITDIPEQEVYEFIEVDDFLDCDGLTGYVADKLKHIDSNHTK